MARMAALVMTKTWTSPILISRIKQKGFTLLEVLIVVGLMAMVTALAVPGIGIATRASLEGSTRDLATTIRSAFDESQLKGRVFRVVFDLDESIYWVEQGPQNLVLQSEKQKEERGRLNARLSKDELEAQKKPTFGISKGVTRDKKSLPMGVKFTDILASNHKDPMTKGLVYTHIFPHGFVEKTIIHVKDKMGHEASLIVDPISGKSRFEGGYFKEGASSL